MSVLNQLRTPETNYLDAELLTRCEERAAELMRLRGYEHGVHEFMQDELDYDETISRLAKRIYDKEMAMKSQNRSIFMTLEERRKIVPDAEIENGNDDEE